MADPPATPIDLSGPQLRGNRQGYRLGDEVVDGFPDQRQLPPFQRRLIAEWAQALDHELSAAQQKLLQTRPTPPKAQLEILGAAQRNGDHDVQRVVESGVYATLDAADVERCEEPQKALGEDRGYPINTTELAMLAGVTYKQIRDWDRGGLLPSHEIDGRRQYCSAAALTA
ncbi:MAG TPA: MerR family transcriptional regulator, partial [Baekduia sp.]|nr:MerR family transcriptional regulator [Baekduia sp.]